MKSPSRSDLRKVASRRLRRWIRWTDLGVLSVLWCILSFLYGWWRWRWSWGVLIINRFCGKWSFVRHFGKKLLLNVLIILFVTMCFVCFVRANEWSSKVRGGTPEVRSWPKRKVKEAMLRLTSNRERCCVAVLYWINRIGTCRYDGFSYLQRSRVFCLWNRCIGVSDAAAQRLGESAWLWLAPGGRFDFVRGSIAALNVKLSWKCLEPDSPWWDFGRFVQFLHCSEHTR